MISPAATLNQIGKILRSPRAVSAISANGLSSLGSLLLSLAIARMAGVGELGSFAVALAAFMMIAGVARSALAEPLAAIVPSVEQMRAVGRQVSTLGIVSGLLAVATSVIMRDPFLFWVGLLAHGIAISEVRKYFTLGFGERRQALVQEGTRFLSAALAAFLINLQAVSSSTGFAIWLVGVSLSGYLFHKRGLKLALLPGWHGPVRANQAKAFGADFLLGSGSANITTFLLAGFAGTAVTGAIRGAGTLLGPAALVAGSAKSLAVPFLARRMLADGGTVWGPSIAASLALIVTTTPILIGVAVLPNFVGEWLLGAVWGPVRPILVPIGLEILLGLLAAIPFAGHRVFQATTRTVVVRGVLAPARILVVVLAGIWGGAAAAAWSMAGVALISSIVWWASYADLMKRRRT